MDIRNYFRKRKIEDTITSDSGIPTKLSTPNPENVEPQASTSRASPEPVSLPIKPTDPTVVVAELELELDIGNYVDVNTHHTLANTKKVDLLLKPFTPPSNYNFKADIDVGGKRPFLFKWLEQYNWLVYSPRLKGALCRHCVLFRPPVYRGGLHGAFISAPFKKFKDFHGSAKEHMKSSWHSHSTMKSKNFMNTFKESESDIVGLMNTAVRDEIANNREKLVPIIKTIIYCATHDSALRGKTDGGNFNDLLSFRIDAGDTVLKAHLETCSANAKYVSHRTQNDFISICGKVIRNELIDEISTSEYFSILADETADISGLEQLSLGVRYACIKDNSICVKEEFLGFVALNELNAQSLAGAILGFFENTGLNLSKLVGQGYDGCSTMAGHINGVQKIINTKYPRALFSHCASHKLNLVVHDLNAVDAVRNTVGTVKDTINFFRESVLRRKLIPNIPMFCETRWSAKYRSIRIFNENFEVINEALDELSESSSNATTKNRGFQLHAATSKMAFIVCLKIMAKYSAQLEPVTNTLQGKTVNLFEVHNHVQFLIATIKKHRENANKVFLEIFKTVTATCKNLGIEVSLPRLSTHQRYRSNYETDSPEDYYRMAIFIPYLDSLIQSLEIRFSKEHKDIYLSFNLHPKNISKNMSKDFVKKLLELYHIQNLEEEVNSWLEYVDQARISKDITLEELISDHCTFYPAIRQVFLLLLTVPPTTCTIERSFSTLRRVKTWLRSTMGQDRLDGLAMLSIHRGRIQHRTENFIAKVIDEFGKEPRKLQFVFKD